MPPQESPVESTGKHLPIGTLIVLLLILLVIAGIAFGWYVVNNAAANLALNSSKNPGTSQTANSPSTVYPLMVAIAPAFSNGNYQAVYQQYQAYESSTTVSAADKDAMEAYDFGSAYRAGGDLTELAPLLQNIDSMKSDVIQNTQLYTFVRVLGINEIATAYAWTGESPQVFKEIFKGSSYRNFLAPNSDPDLSIRNLFQWSWTLQPTSMAGGWLAGLDMNYVLSTPNLSSSDKQTYISQTEAYMQTADTLEAQDPSQQARPDYAGYLFWEAFAYGALAHEVGGVYEQQYKTKYQDLISFLQQQNSVPNLQWEPYADYFYAVFLKLNDNDVADAQTQLANSVALVKADPDPAMDEFSNYVKNKELQESQSGMSSLDFKAQQLYTMSAISPGFKAFMSNLSK